MPIELWRLYLTVALPFLGLLIKWFTVSLRRGLGDGRCGGKRIPVFEFGKHFRMTGWDLAGTSMAFYVVALVVRTSPLHQIISEQTKKDGLDGLWWVLSFVYYLVLLGLCAGIRYVTQEVREVLRTDRWRWAFLGWALGGYLFALAGKWAISGV